jgi:hypothetical protein
MSKIDPLRIDPVDPIMWEFKNRYKFDDWLWVQITIFNRMVSVPLLDLRFGVFTNTPL